MYSKDFYISENLWNNAFSFFDRKNPKIFIPQLKKIQSIEEIHLLDSTTDKITFEEYDFDWNMQQSVWLQNLYELDWKWKKIFLVDNHNHVFYFWYLARSQGIIRDHSLLYHIDEHADTRDPWEYLLKPHSQDLKLVFEYTNYVLNVGNYIIPAEKEGIIWQTIQIRSEEALKTYLEIYLNWKQSQSIILNLDLDFFEPELDYIDYELKKQVILDIAQKSDLITVCTSPYFINQERALWIFKDIFKF